jgi:hypothetical protein
MLEIYAPKETAFKEMCSDKDASAKFSEEVAALNKALKDVNASGQADKREEQIACGCSAGQSPQPYRYDAYQSGYYAPRVYYTPSPSDGYYNQGSTSGYDPNRYVTPAYVPVRTDRGVILMPTVRSY